ncbi:tetratricopeptide repeat protein [Natronosalvus halobius]|uniref:tetratricopeptide repeat protein n=1 Tax=Natronosalvus halobius TaxID=2953746 RepID=UPI00209D887C|nr:tetratricopeptide repeat protein [Natronosalvus halobius]USZ71177.1 tetratricopeptide repeat protein [Natronosalvus halobius]
MTDRQEDSDRRHRFSEGAGFDESYEEFDLDPPELDVDPSRVDPIDSRALTDMLDERQIGSEDVDAQELIDVGLSYTQINRYEQATEAFERAAQFTDDPATEQEAWVNKGVAHAELEEYDEAIGAHREALRIAREAEEDAGEYDRSSPEHTATAHTNLAYALWEFGETAEALDHAERAVEVDDRFAEGWYNRAFFLADRGLTEDALHSIDNAIRLGLRNAPVLEEKARILEELGEDEQAEALAEEANELREQAEQQLVEEREQMRE